jgi:hypothetical protein
MNKRIYMIFKKTKLKMTVGAEGRIRTSASIQERKVLSTVVFLEDSE